MVRILLIRHAATHASKRDLLLGATDASAGVIGLQQLERLTSLLAPYHPQGWYCSPMLRAVQTSEKLQALGAVDQQYRIEKRLREIDFGRWEEKSFADIKRSDPDMIHDWAGYDGFVFPDGEAVAGFAGRIRDVLETFRNTGYKEIGVVTHGGVIRTMICLALGLSPRNYLLFSVAPASLTILDLYPEGGVLSALNC